MLHTCALSLLQGMTRVGLSIEKRREVQPGPLKDYRPTEISFPRAQALHQAWWQVTPTWMGNLKEVCPRDQRVPPFLFQGNIYLLNSSVLTKLPGNKKTQKPNNGNDQANKTRDFLIFSLKVSLKHLCVALSSVNIESTGYLPMLLPHSFLCHFLSHTQGNSSRHGEKGQP